MKWISGQRHPRGSRGQVALEALVGFLLFGAMMALYLPALHQAYQRLEDSQVASQEWRLFALMAEGWMRQDQDWLSLVRQAHPQILDFACQDQDCWIEFERGSHYHVQTTD